ncbi:MAG: sulfotransferase family protein [Actinomycetes bacterium]
MDRGGSAEGVPRRLVLVTGSGRSGTSTVAGLLSHLGLYVPQPVLPANQSNPRGFYESSWPVTFHQRLAKHARINQFDARPDAEARVRAAVTDAHRTELGDWLNEQAEFGRQLVVKDPRSVFSLSLWADAAREADLPIRYLSMLRHPAEVLGSYATYYTTTSDQARRRRYQVFILARWLNATLTFERGTRGQPRTFVSYPDLLDDWRGTMDGVREDLGLQFPAPWVAGRPHAGDDFLDPDLRRMRTQFADLAMPRGLQAIAEEVWDSLEVLTQQHGADPTASARLDELAARYAELYEDALAITQNAYEAAVAEARRAGAAKARRALRQERRVQAPSPSAADRLRRVVRRARQVLADRT